MWGIFFEAGVFFQFAYFAIDADADEALFLQAFEEVAVVAGFAADEGCEENGSGALWEGGDLVGDIWECAAEDGLAGGGVVGLADGRVEDAEVVVDFGGGGDCRARVGCRCALLDGDGGREAFDEIDVGFFEAV